MAVQRFVRRFTCFLFISWAATGCNGPLPFLSGGELSGTAKPVPATWSLEEDFAVVQLETRPEDPYSVNIAYTQIDGRLYINAGDTETEWVTHISSNPLVRLRDGQTIYELRAERVTEAAEVAMFGEAWTSHSTFHRDPTELGEVWIYRLVSR